MEVASNKTRAWVRETREILTLSAGTKVEPIAIGKRHSGSFNEASAGRLLVGRLEDGTEIEVRLCNMR